VNDLIAWEWDFGDGGTATGQEVWHQFRSANNGSPWGVTLKVTDTAQSEAVKRKLVPVSGGKESEACGYTMQRVGTTCEMVASARPSVPTGSQLPLHREDVWTSWWEAPPSGALYFLVEVYFPQFEEGDVAHRMDCLWTVCYLGERGDARPRLVKEYELERRTAEAGTAYAVGFPRQLMIEEDLSEAGWYRVFADIQRADGNRRTVVDFLVNAGGRPLQS
jgi:hypothetical protein